MSGIKTIGVIAMIPAVIALMFSVSAEASVVLRHLGTADPATEGWTASPLGPGVTVGPTSPPAVAWSVQDASGADGSGIGYSRDLTPCQAAMISAAGWTMRVCLKVDDPDNQASMWFGYNTDSRRFDLWFTSDVTGSSIVQLMTGVTIPCGPMGRTYTVTDRTPTCHIAGFHLYELVYSSSTQTADLYVDGVMRIGGYAGHTVGLSQFPGIAWGAGSSCADGSAEFRLVEFEVSGFTFADLNCDGHVNGLDLALLLGQWTGATRYSPCPPLQPADLNQDCKINGLDLALLLGAWAP